MAVTALSNITLLLAMASVAPRDVVTEMAASLASGNAANFLRPIASTMPDREELARNIRTLTEAYEISSSVQIVTESQSGESTTLDLDWFLELKPRAGSGELIRRRERVQVRLDRFGKSWKVTALQPVAFFSAP
jgi:hypothetical protein